ncbi:MAG TPA: cation diffusion facilitator family transporter [Acidimicrobiales bacterium]|nr:cation diffusion facilitator family transporter [Acidimicrobiales bacterium]
MSRSVRLWLVLGANLAMVGALLGVGLSAHSVGVWAEGADYLADAAGIGVALLAIRLEAPTRRRPGGHPRAARYAALLNAGWLLALTLLVAGDAADRLVSGPGRVKGLPVLVVSGIASVVMLFGAIVLAGDSDDHRLEPEDHATNDAANAGGQLSVRAVLLDTAADAAAAAGVAVAGAIIFATGGLFWLDPAIALAISIVVGAHAIRLVRQIWAALKI